MPRIAKFVHDLNIMKFQEQLAAATDPAEIKRLKDFIEREEQIYEASLRARRGHGDDQARH